ncbi:hypothetical protein HMSSN036_15830 [Paenibacillus macerans]|nr:hypothetical protein HMSSN036_15830 [Paenibacillus macerans]
MTIELATEVYDNDSIQNKKCNPRKMPDKNMVLQSFLFNGKDPIVCHGTKGINIKTVIYNLYIPATEDGVFEDLIMMEEMATAKMLMNSRI